MLGQAEQITAAIKAELGEASRPVVLVVGERSEDQSIWTIRLAAPAKLNENQEGWTAWWPAGRASVISVVPEEGIVFLHFLTGHPPGSGEALHLYPPRFLEELCELWKRPSLAEEALSNGKLSAPVQLCEPLSTANFPWLRERQRDAFHLASYRSGYLWGPPGTGKTRTLGALLASYLFQFRQDRILVVSSTNSAVDQSILSIDRSVDELVSVRQQGTSLRGEYLRMGVHFIAKNYLGKEHLLPTSDSTILLKLACLEDTRPPSANAAMFAKWKEEVRAVQRTIPRSLSQSRLIAITVTEAILKYDELQASGKFDLLVFDEASQVGRAQSLILATLAQKVIYAGDPEQLSPIVQSKNNPPVERWLGSSMFDEMKLDSPTTCFLNEQSRMTKDICETVSRVFYEGKLTLAKDCATPGWRAERSLPFVDGYGESSLILPPVKADGIFSQKYGGWIRHESAGLIASLIDRMLTCLDMDEDKILVLTPYHAQNLLIKHMVNMKRRKPISVRTVHSAQGQECHTVFFDPVNGREGLKHGKASARLINVAISRAKACLVVPLSAGDLDNDQLNGIHEAATGQRRPTAKLTGVHLNEIATVPGFPKAFLKQLVITTLPNGIEIQAEIVDVAPDGSTFDLRETSGKRTIRRHVTQIVMLNAEKQKGVRPMLPPDASSPSESLPGVEEKFHPKLEGAQLPNNNKAPAPKVFVITPPANQPRKIGHR